MVEGAEKVDEAGVGAEASESTSSSSSLGRCASLGESDLFLRVLLRVSPAAGVAVAAEAACEGADEPGRREASRRRDLSSRSPRLVPDMDLMSKPSL